MLRYFTILMLATCFSLQLSAQASYETSYDTKEQTAPVKILKGVISKSLINNDTSFNWYNPSHDNYFPDSTVIAAFKKAKRDSVQFILFGGTWCEDTQFIIPKFFRLQEGSGIADNQITFFGVDRSKKTVGNIAAAFNITNVPTIIVMKAGKEIGRVVEYGQSGKWDVDLAKILSEP